MKRLAASLAFAAIILVPAVSFAQGYGLRPTTKLRPCDRACKSVQCSSFCDKRAAILCRNPSSGEAHYACVLHVRRTCLPYCMR